jgi:hypothetical protein
MAKLNLAELPRRVGPVEIDRLGALFAVRCPADLAPLLRDAGAAWEPTSRRWLMPGTQLVKLVPRLRRATDPLVRRAGIDLDER